MQVSPEKAFPPAENKNISELTDCIDSGGRWFWHTGEVKLQNAEVLAARIKLCNTRSTNVLLDVPPGRDGLIDDLYVQHLMEIQRLISKN